ncbi:MAG: FAD-dependent monooxygenase [Chitinophagia bacterium]|nr:FAD-dependent monooxygenase [Chitinophagia bacterium]
MSRSVTILGAGLVGSLLAVMLRKRGFEVAIYERRSDMRLQTMSAGRSINLAVSHRAWHALSIAGLKELFEDIAIPMYGRTLHQIDGSVVFQQYGKNREAIYSVSRGELNKKLMTAAEEAGAKINFEHKCVEADIPNNRFTFEQANGQTTSIQADLVFGADGAFSALRSGYTKVDRVNAVQEYIEHGYKELTIPAAATGAFQLEKEALHIWPRRNFMMIALPNTDASFTCTLFFPFHGTPSFDSVKTNEEILQFFNEQFPDAVPLMPTLLEDFTHNPTASLVTTRIFPWVYKNKSALIGDAAHAIVPFYGQGMNAGFEDCSVLMQCMDQCGDDWEAVLAQYQKLRKPNGDAVLQLALYNFIEMRDKVADPEFLERKKIEKDLGLRYPTQFNSIYEMVSFSHIPYSTAWQCIEKQDSLLQRIMQAGNYFELIATDAFKKQVDAWMNDYHASVATLEFGNGAH